jgi:RNA polymerase sigma-70 factor (ECF subfamily)
MTDEPHDVTHWLNRAAGGDEEAQSMLLRVIYGELHKIAARYMRKERSDHTLQATALVNEAYLRLAASHNRHWQNRTHFIAVAAQAMRCVLVDYARARCAEKRGGSKLQVELNEALATSLNSPESIISLNSALERMAEWDYRQSRIVELRFFGGLSEEEVSEVLGISVRTVKREWMLAKAWLRSELTGSKTK